MSFTCLIHGWRDPQCACPICCPTVYRASGIEQPITMDNSILIDADQSWGECKIWAVETIEKFKYDALKAELEVAHATLGEKAKEWARSFQERDALQTENQKLREALEKIREADCPNNIVLPHTVWLEPKETP